MNTYRKKLIEVDLPLNDINRESANEPISAPGHPFTLHQYWARRPLATCRAVIFASMVDDPSSCPEEFPTERAQTKERERLHELIRRLVVWKNSNDERLLAEARYEIARTVARCHGEIAPTDPDGVLRYLDKKALPIYDPFCGGGIIPLEAQRLGLRTIGSDLNPLSVLITKAIIELPHAFRNRPPVNPQANPLGKNLADGKWKGTAGLANDIRYYGAWMHEEAHKRIDHLYPLVQLPDGSTATVVAWLWARTVLCANPACNINMPLMKTFQLTTNKGNQHWTRPVVDRELNTVSFIVQNHNHGVPEHGTVKGNNVTCVACGDTVKLEKIREQARAGKIEETLTAIVVESKGKRLFVSPRDEHLKVAFSAKPAWIPITRLPDQAMGLSVQSCGITHWHQLFTQRQLTTLATFGDLLKEVRGQIMQDCAEDKYADAVCTYLALTVGKTANTLSNLAIWRKSQGNRVVKAFGLQGLSIAWDFAEANIFSSSKQNWIAQLGWVANVVEQLPTSANSGEVYQANACTTIHAQDGHVIVTDPPYYNNISYADLSDFFYVWLRPLLRDTYPELFAGMMTPKADEMIDNQHRFENSRNRFEKLLGKAFLRMRQHCPDQFPLSIFYSYKQQEEVHEGITSTGWETMLTAIVSTGFQIVGTWPMRTEQTKGLKAQKNVLASSIVLVCRPRPDDAQVSSRRQFLDELEREMPVALDQFTRDGHIAPVDLAQAAIGPGMKVYSQYSRVERVSGELVPVREALADINKQIDAYFEQEEGDFDAETRFCFAWLKLYGYAEGKFSEAALLTVAKAVSIDRMERLLTSGGSIVQLRSPDEYYEEVEGEEVHKVRAELPLEGITTAWEGCLHMMFHLNLKGGKTFEGAAEVAEAMRNNSDCSPLSSVERLARLLYNYYDRQRDSANAVYFNNLVTSWDKIMSAMEDPKQRKMF